MKKTRVVTNLTSSFEFKFHGPHLSFKDEQEEDEECVYKSIEEGEKKDFTTFSFLKPSIFIFSPHHIVIQSSNHDMSSTLLYMFLYMKCGIVKRLRFMTI